MFDNEIYWGLGIIGINLLIAVFSLCAFRLIHGLLEGVSTTDELAKKDNFAFGLGFAGGALALAMIMAAAIDGMPAEEYIEEISNILVYGLTGILLLRVGTLLNDVFIFNQFSIKQSIAKENLAAGVIQAGNYVALGLIISSVIQWIETESYHGLLSVVLVFISAQATLLLLTRYRATVFSKRNQGAQLQTAIEQGNLALSIRYTGHLIAAALGISASGHFVSYHEAAPWLPAGWWFATSLLIIILMSVLSALARRFILHRINVVEEVDQQQNIGVAFIEAVIFIGIALILNPLVYMFDYLV